MPNARGGYNAATILVMEFKRVTTDAQQMGGVPCLRGLRIPVATVVSLVAEGQTVERILTLYPDLEAEDVREALFFAAEAVRERTLPLAAGQLGCSSTTRCLRRLPTFRVTPVTKPRTSREVGLHHANDEEIFERAAAEDFILVSADTDFGTLLAKRSASKPSLDTLSRRGQP